MIRSYLILLIAVLIFNLACNSTEPDLTSGNWSYSETIIGKGKPSLQKLDLDFNFNFPSPKLTGKVKVEYYEKISDVEKSFSVEKSISGNYLDPRFIFSIEDENKNNINFEGKWKTKNGDIIGNLVLEIDNVKYNYEDLVLSKY